LRQLFRMRFFRILIFLSWLAGMITAVAGFLFSQSITTGGWLESFAANFGPRAEAIASAFTAMVLLYPDIVVHGLFSALFMVLSDTALFFSLVGMTVAVPRLITHDRASNALTIYLSRPLTSFDYLVGKFGIVVGVLLVTWTGPLLLAWLLSVLFAPDTVFITYSLIPLGRALLFNLIGLVVLASIAFAISSLAKTTTRTILLWIGAWILVGMVAGFPGMPDWFKHISFTYGLEQAEIAIFQITEIASRAAAVIPVYGDDVSQAVDLFKEHARPAPLGRSLGGLAVLVGLSSLVFFRRFRPE
jgi:ABC-2 type transport system permease protein